MNLDFIKANGTGNVFLFLDNRKDKIPNLSKLSVSLCNPNFGIGADGVFFLQSSSDLLFDFKVQIFNSDGSQAAMCGNGIRCLHAFLFYKKISQKPTLKFQTLRGEILTKLISTNPFIVQANMGPPIFADESITSSNYPNLLNIPIEGRSFGYVSMGNPHCITEVSDFDWDYTALGQKIEKKIDLFPDGTNVEFVKILSNQEIQLRIWERGCKETFSCGTGACASVVYLTKMNKLAPNKEITVHLLGGVLQIHWDQNINSVFMQGGCTLVCEGTILL